MVVAHRLLGPGQFSVSFFKWSIKIKIVNMMKILRHDCSRRKGWYVVGAHHPAELFIKIKIVKVFALIAALLDDRNTGDQSASMLLSVGSAWSRRW